MAKYAFPVQIVNRQPAGEMVIFGRNDQRLVLYNFNTDLDISGVFKGNNFLIGYELPDGTTFDGIEKAEESFADCTSLEGFREGVTFRSLKDGSQMFMNCEKLTTLPSTVNLDALEDGQEMFMNCTSLESLPDGTTLRNAKNVNRMFANCKSLRHIPESIDLVNIGVDRILWKHHEMFSGCCLTAQSVKNVLNALPATDEGLNFDIGSTHDETVDWRNDEEIAAMLNTSTPINYADHKYFDMDKGWSVYIEN